MKINGETIAKIRKEMGMSREELAGRVHLGVRQIARLEKGDSDLNIWQMMEVLEMLGHPSDDFWLFLSRV